MVDKKIIAVHDFLSPNLPRYWCICRLKAVVNGNYEVLLNFGQGEIVPELYKQLHKPKVLCFSNGQVIIEIAHDRMISASAVFNAMLQAQVDGILPK
jgi:hypothetical protein